MYVENLFKSGMATLNRVLPRNGQISKALCASSFPSALYDFFLWFLRCLYYLHGRARSRSDSLIFVCAWIAVNEEPTAVPCMQTSCEILSLLLFYVGSQRPKKGDCLKIHDSHMKLNV